MTRTLFVLLTLICGSAGGADVSPPEVLSAIRIGDGMCSATTILRGPTYSYHLSCAHCCGGVGNEVVMDLVSGQRMRGRWIATDQLNDLALIRSYSTGILSEVEVAADSPAPSALWRGVGWPAGNGPNITTMKFNGLATCGHWTLAVESGTYTGGNSGGGLFADGKLTGVTSAMEGNSAHAVVSEKVLEFLVSNRDKFTDPACPNGKCPTNKPWLQPNVPIVLPKTERQSPDTFKDTAATKHILDLEARVAALEKRLTALENLKLEVAPKPIDKVPDVPPPPKESLPVAGVQGPPGRDGKDGAPGPERTINVVFRWADGTPIGAATVPPGKNKVTQILERIKTASK